MLHHHPVSIARAAGVTIAIVLAAGAPSAASARPNPNPDPAAATRPTQAPRAADLRLRHAADGAVQAQGARVARELAARNAAIGNATVSFASPPIVRVTAPHGGFDCGADGIGAAGGVAVSLLGLGAALVISSERTWHPAVPRSPAA